MKNAPTHGTLSVTLNTVKEPASIQSSTGNITQQLTLNDILNLEKQYEWLETHRLIWTQIFHTLFSQWPEHLYTFLNLLYTPI